MSEDITVGIVEDEKRTREGLAKLIGGTPGYTIVGEFSSMEEGLRNIGLNLPRVLLLDINLPGLSGIEGARQLKARYPDLQILMLTVYADNENVFEAICAGACGYLLKDTAPARLLEAIRDLNEGGAPMSPEIARKVVSKFQKIETPKKVDHQLSPRELLILRTLADGHSYKTAAFKLSISIDTVRFHIRHIYEKLHVHSKSEALLTAQRTGII